MELEVKSLYSITEEHLNLLALIDENEGEITPEIEAMMQINEHDLQVKSQSYAHLIHRLEDEEEAAGKYLERINKYISQRKRLRENIRARLSEALLLYGVEKIETPEVKISFRKSEIVDIQHEDLIPAEYIETKVTQSPSKTKIKEAIKEGLSVPGAALIVKQNIQIK
jgi:hypothetical protein